MRRREFITLLADFHSFGLWRPTTGAEKNAVFESWDINIVNSKVRPIERGLHRIERDRFVYLVHLGDIQDRLRPIDLLEILNDFQNGWLGSVEVQAGRRLQGVSPRRPEEDNDKMVCGMFFRSH